MSLEAFRLHYQLDAGNASFGEQATSAELAAGKPTRYFSFTPRAGLPNVLGGLLKLQGTLTATGAESPVAGSDQLDLFIGGGGQVQVAPASGGAARCLTLTRQFAEFVWAVTTNTSFTVAANPTFASAGTSNVTVYLFVPLGGPAAVIRLFLSGNIAAAYAAGVTIAYTGVTSYVISTTWTGVVAFDEEKTASLGTNLQSVTTYLPQTIAPDAIFMQGDSSSTITQVSITTTSGYVLVNSTDTDVLEQGAVAVAPVAGATYTTTAGFVIAGNQQAFQTFQLAFASSAVHYIGYLQCGGGDDTPSPSPAPVAQPAAVSQTGQPTATGGVAAGPGGAGSMAPVGTGGRPVLPGLSGVSPPRGGPGGIISRRQA